MRFSLQDVKKTIHRKHGELTVGLQFLRTNELTVEIEKLIAYHESLLGQPQASFAVDDARACIGEYRLAHCLIATLSYWYSWHTRDWVTAIQSYSQNADLLVLSSPVQLRLLLYAYVNKNHHGFLSAGERPEVLSTFATQYQLTRPQLEDLLALDADDEAILTRTTLAPPTVQDVVQLYNQWIFESALFNASRVRFEIDCAAFSALDERQQAFVPVTGVGAVIKRLCFLARKLGVYYDLEYEQTTVPTAPRLILTLYGPQEVTGSPQQYGLRLAQLCRMLSGYNAQSRSNGRAGRKPSLAGAIVAAEAQIHFLQRAYRFEMDAALLQFISVRVEQTARPASNAVDAGQVFDSSIEQFFSEAFLALTHAHGADGWMLEREPEPLLLPDGIVIPDFAVTRGQKRIYVEILGFWTPAYRERKVQKLQQLRAREDFMLAIPVEAREAFATIASDFPIVYYQGQLSASDVLQTLRSHYDDFADRLSLIDHDMLYDQIYRVGFMDEQECYQQLHCYRRSELLQAADLFVQQRDDLVFRAGLGLYSQAWLLRFQRTFLGWMAEQQQVALTSVFQKMRTLFPELQRSDESALEALLSTCSQITVQHDSIFEATVELSALAVEKQPISAVGAMETSSTPEKKVVREPRTTMSRKKSTKKTDLIQGDLWN